MLVDFIARLEKILNVNSSNAKVALYRNQSNDLLCKSIDWFLNDGNFGVSWVNIKALHLMLLLIKQIRKAGSFIHHEASYMFLTIFQLSDFYFLFVLQMLYINLMKTLVFTTVLNPFWSEIYFFEKLTLKNRWYQHTSDKRKELTPQSEAY